METPPGEEVDDAVDVGIYDATFTEPQTSFLTLFRMMLGSFDMVWFQRKHDLLLTMVAYILFIICKCESPLTLIVYFACLDFQFATFFISVGLFLFLFFMLLFENKRCIFVPTLIFHFFNIFLFRLLLVL